MKTTMTLALRRFPVTIKDERTGEVSKDTVVLDKETLNAAQRTGQSSRELIYRIYNRAGYRVLEIGKAERANVDIRLDQAFPTLPTGQAEVTAHDAG